MTGLGVKECSFWNWALFVKGHDMVKLGTKPLSVRKIRILRMSVWRPKCPLSSSSESLRTEARAEPYGEVKVVGSVNVEHVGYRVED